MSVSRPRSSSTCKLCIGYAIGSSTVAQRSSTRFALEHFLTDSKREKKLHAHEPFQKIGVRTCIPGVHAAGWSCRSDFERQHRPEGCRSRKATPGDSRRIGCI